MFDVLNVSASVFYLKNTRNNDKKFIVHHYYIITPEIIAIVPTIKQYMAK